uniref:Uncharacterized protein n=1 Tax=Plectus sambesii TaxID=2011161 RepID=A0A914V0U3_9BILA
GSLVFIFVNNPPDLSKRLNQDRMLTMVDNFERLQYSMGRNSTSIWLRPFLNHAILYESENASSFHNSLFNWLGNDEDGGGRWRNFVHYHQDNATGEVTIEKFFFTTGSALGDDVGWTTRTILQDNWRAVTEEYADFNITIFQAYSFYVDQLNSIAGNTL